MSFLPEEHPFPEWLGPYSPARGNMRGLRVKGNQLGMFFNDDTEQCFCSAKETDEISMLANLVTQYYQGGRVLFLPNGLIIKPLQTDEERCQRVIIGQYSGDIEIISKAGFSFSTENLDTIKPGEMLSKNYQITSMGLECSIQSDGSIRTKWYERSDAGFLQTNIEIAGPNQKLLNGFRRARPDDTGGRVHVIIGGHVFTNHKISYNEWRPYYVGKLELSNFESWRNKWSGKHNL